MKKKLSFLLVCLITAMMVINSSITAFAETYDNVDLISNYGVVIDYETGQVFKGFPPDQEEDRGKRGLRCRKSDRQWKRGKGLREGKARRYHWDSIWNEDGEGGSAGYTRDYKKGRSQRSIQIFVINGNNPS